MNTITTPEREACHDIDIIDLQSSTFVLDNGLTVIVYENHEAPLVSLNLVYKVGSKDEVPGKTGFAHLFEHLMFEGSENAPGPFINYMFQAGASNLNATTGQDRTTYFETVPVGSLDYALFLESDRMGHFYSRINQVALDQQRRVVLNEKLETESGVYGKLFGYRIKGCYPPEHPYSHTVIGEVEDLQQATLEDVRHWFRTYYTPTNAVLTLAGDIDVATAREKVTQWFGAIPGGTPLVKQAAWVPDIPWGRRDVFQAPVQNGSLHLYWNIPPYGHTDSTLLSMVATLLASGMTSPLVKRLVYEEKVASSVSTSLEYAELVSQFVVSVSLVGDASFRDIERIVDEELQRFLLTPPDEALLQRTKNQQLVGFSSACKTLSPVADILTTSQVTLGRADGYRAVLADIKAATGAQLQDVVRRWLLRNRYTLDMVPFPATSVSETTASRAEFPDILPPKPVVLPELEHARLKNGMKVTLARRASHPSVTLEMVMSSGFDGEAGVAALTCALINQSGVGETDAFAFSSALHDAHALIDVMHLEQMTRASLSCPANTLGSAVALLGDRLRRTTILEEDFTRQRTVRLDDILDQQNSAEAMIHRILPALMYPQGHPYCVPGGNSLTYNALENMSFSQILSCQRQLFVPESGQIMVVGDTTLTEIVVLLDEALGEWHEEGVRAEKTALSVIAPRGRPQVFLIDNKGTGQSVIAAASLIPGVEWDQEALFFLANEIFADGFSSRINQNLREEKNWSYGVNGMLINERGSRVHCVMTAVQTDRTVDAIREIHQEYVALNGEKPITEAELEQIRNQILLRFIASAEGPNGLLGLLAHIQNLGLTEEYWQHYQEQLAGADLQQVNRMAQQCFRPDGLTWVIAGDLALIAEDIKTMMPDAVVVKGNGDSLFCAEPVNSPDI